MPPAEAWVHSVQRWPGGRVWGGSRLNRDGKGLLEGKVMAQTQGSLLYLRKALIGSASSCRCFWHCGQFLIG